METDSSGWYLGNCNGRVGWFPSNYVEKIGSGAPRASMATSSPVVSNGNPNSQYPPTAPGSAPYGGAYNNPNANNSNGYNTAQYAPPPPQQSSYDNNYYQPPAPPPAPP